MAVQARAAELRIELRFLPGERGGPTSFTAYAETDAAGKYCSPPLFPSQYIMEKNAGDLPLVATPFRRCWPQLHRRSA